MPALLRVAACAVFAGAAATQAVSGDGSARNAEAAIAAAPEAAPVAAVRVSAGHPGAAYVAIRSGRRRGMVIAAASCARKTQLVLAPYTSPHSRYWCGDNQAWIIRPLRSGYASIHAKYRGRSECMTIIGSYRIGARLDARACDPSHPGRRETFRLPEMTPDRHYPGTYYIVPGAGHGLCLTEAERAKTGRRRPPRVTIALRRCGRSTGGAWAIPAAPAHTETWAFDDSAARGSCNGGRGASRSLVRQWLTYAETNCGPRSTKALRDCHVRDVTYCTVIQYFDASKIWSRNPIRSAPASEDWWLHELGYTNAAHRLTETSKRWGRAFWLNQMNKAAHRWIVRYLRSHYNAWDGLEMDDTAASLKTQFHRPGIPAREQYTSSQELRTNAALVREHESLARVLRHVRGAPFEQVDNGINPNPFIRKTLPLLNHPRSVVGLISEGSPWDYGFSPYYSSLLDVIAAVDARPGTFIVLLSYDREGSQQARRVQEATVLLGYEPGHVVSWADLEQRSLDLSVWPEEGIYPTNPIQSMAPPRGRGCLAGVGALCPTGGHNDLQVAVGFSPADRGAGVYRREFRDCYDRGVRFGRCAAIVNDTSRSVKVSASWLKQSYRHVITMRGGEVQSGGRIDLAGAAFRPGLTSIPAHDAILLAQ